jgi:hypothetical protein
MGSTGSTSNGPAGEHGGTARCWLETRWHATDQIVVTEELTLSGPQVVHVASFESVSRGPSFASKENHGTTLDMLFVGSRVCVCGQPQTCGEVVRVVPMTGRVVVRLDPPHPAWRGTLRSFRPERLVIYS